MRTQSEAEERGTVAWTDYMFALVLLPLSVGWFVVTLGFSWIWGEGAIFLSLLVFSVSLGRCHHTSLPLVATVLSVPAAICVWIAGQAFLQRIDPRFFSLSGTIVEIVVIPLVFLPLFRVLSHEYALHLETSVDWLRPHGDPAELGYGCAIFHLFLLIPFILLLLVHIGLWLFSPTQAILSVDGLEWWFVRMVFGAWIGVGLAFGCAAVWYFHHSYEL